jgi:hypothetical protein
MLFRRTDAHSVYITTSYSKEQITSYLTSLFADNYRLIYIETVKNSYKSYCYLYIKDSSLFWSLFDKNADGTDRVKHVNYRSIHSSWAVNKNIVCSEIAAPLIQHPPSIRFEMATPCKVDCQILISKQPISQEDYVHIDNYLQFFDFNYTLKLINEHLAIICSPEDDSIHFLYQMIRYINIDEKTIAFQWK